MPALTRDTSTTSPLPPRGESASSPSSSTSACPIRVGDWLFSSPTRLCRPRRRVRCCPTRYRLIRPFTTRRERRCWFARSPPSGRRCSSTRFATASISHIACTFIPGLRTSSTPRRSRAHTAPPSAAPAPASSRSVPARKLDMLIANGETITAPLVAMCLEGMGVPAISLSGLQAGVRTSAHHSRARIHDIQPDRILEALGQGKVVVVAGFQGVTDDMEVTTLGRGGSDTTAVALAAALKADSCEIYTDVDGIFTADPRVVKSARKLSYIGYDEMLELAAVGARVMHPRAVEIGELYSVPIHVRSSFHGGVGTMIVAKVPMEDRQRVRGIAQETNVAKITVIGVADRPGVAATIFEPLGKAGISVDVIVQNIGRSGRTDLTFSVAESDLKAAEKLVRIAAKQVGASRVSSAGGIAKLSIVGTGMLGMPGIAGRMFRALADAGINIEMISTSEIRITCLVARDQVEKGVRILHKTFELDRK